jgi:hypothetical protein
MGFKTFENEIFLEILYINFDIIIFLEIQKFEIFLKTFVKIFQGIFPKSKILSKQLWLLLSHALAINFLFDIDVNGLVKRMK